MDLMLISSQDIKDWCDVGQLKIENKTSPAPNKRDFLQLAMPVVLDAWE